MFCSVCCSWCLYFPLPCLQLLVVLTVFTSTSKACNPGEATEKTTGSQSRSCSSDHRGECEVFGQYYGWARWADWAPRGNTESGVWCASWSVAARHWHTHTYDSAAGLCLPPYFLLHANVRLLNHPGLLPLKWLLLRKHAIYMELNITEQMWNSHGRVAVEADVQVVFQSINGVPGQPLQQHIVKTLHQSTLQRYKHEREKKNQLCSMLNTELLKGFVALFFTTAFFFPNNFEQ